MNARENLVVVGVDGSPGSLEALRVALEEAKLRKASLRAVMAWHLSWSDVALETPGLVARVEKQAADVLETALATIDHGKGSGVEVSGELVNGPAGGVLQEAAWNASLLVVGTRGTAGLTGTLVGSVAHAAIHHARCPVLVVPLPAD